MKNQQTLQHNMCLHIIQIETIGLYQFISITQISVHCAN